MIYFGDVLLKNAEEPAENVDIVFSTTRLLSGKQKIQVSAETSRKFTFSCHTTDPADISALINLIGTAGTLKIDDAEYPNFYITAFTKTWESNNNWTYEITLQEDTSL